MRLRLIGLGTAGLLLAGCAGSVSDTDLRVTATNDGLYLLTRSTAVARSVCIAAGGDALRAERWRFAEGPFQLGNDVRPGTGIQGCQVPSRKLIVCQEGDAGCVSGSGWQSQNAQDPEP